jgi:hypothetical protein
VGRYVDVVSRYGGVVGRYLEVVGRYVDVVSRYGGVVGRYLEVVGRYVDVVSRVRLRDDDSGGEDVVSDRCEATPEGDAPYDFLIRAHLGSEEDPDRREGAKMTDERPNPDELLRKVAEEERRDRRGKLTIFFGAAPDGTPARRSYRVFATSMSTRRSSCHALLSLPVASSAPREVSLICGEGTPNPER